VLENVEGGVREALMGIRCLGKSFWSLFSLSCPLNNILFIIQPGWSLWNHQKFVY